MVGLVLLAVGAQIARNWIALDAIGVHASVLDAVAVLIAMVVLSQLPIGPAVGATAVMAILGANGMALSAAAGRAAHRHRARGHALLRRLGAGRPLPAHTRATALA